MHAMKHSRVFLAVATTLLLSACGKEDVPAADNIAPTITVSQTNSVNEGDLLKIPFVGADTNESTGEAIDASSLKYALYNTNGEKLSASEIDGTVSIDLENMELNYTAPWVSTGNSSSENFVLRVTDAGNLFAESNVLITTNDINDPVDVVMGVPKGAYGYQNTQEDTELNFWYAESSSEGDMLTVTFNIEERDADHLSFDYSVTEGLVFENQILAEDLGNQVTLSIPTPKIKTPSENFTLSFSVDDGDDTVTAVANVTIVNKPTLSWDPSSARTISESSGGSLKFLTSESSDYAGQYSYKVTDEKGDNLDFSLPVEFLPQDGTINFSSSSGVQGDKSIVVTVYLTSEISHAGGESYEEVTELTRTINLSDDRDDDFNVSTEEFFELKSGVVAAFDRSDEVRLANTYGQYLFLNGFINKSQSEELVKAVSIEADTEEASLTELASKTVSAINSNSSDTFTLMNEYATEANNLGYASRVKLKEIVDSYSVSYKEGMTPKIEPPKISSGGFLVDGEFTHYIGNTDYGNYEDEGIWVFNTPYHYMKTVDFETIYETSY